MYRWVCYLRMNYKPYTCNYGGQENENDPEGEGQVMTGLETLDMPTEILA